MNIKKSLSFLKEKIDSFECSYVSGGKNVIGLEALRFWLRNTYRSNPIKTETYVSRQLTALYEKLEQNEDGQVFNSDHFSFMKDADVFFTLLKGLKITFEELMDPDKETFQPEASYEILHSDNEALKNQIDELTNLFKLKFGYSERSSFDEKQKEYTSLLANLNCLINLKQKNENKTPEEKKEILENIRLSYTMATVNALGKIIPQNISEFVKKDIPIDFFQIQYFKAIKESKTSEITRALRDLRDNQKNTYYDRLAERIYEEIKTTFISSSTSSGIQNDNKNFLLYSCNVCLFDFVNRMTICYTNSFSCHYMYQCGKQYQKAKEEENILFPTYLISNNTEENFFLCFFKSESVKRNFQLVKENVSKFQELFLKKINSMLRQLSNYLTKMQERNYSDMIVNEIKSLFEEYISILILVIYERVWYLDQTTETRIQNFIDKFNEHTIILNHDMGAINEAY